MSRTIKRPTAATETDMRFDRISGGLPPQLAERLAAYHQRTGLSAISIVRKLIADHLPAPGDPEPSEPEAGEQVGLDLFGKPASRQLPMSEQVVELVAMYRHLCVPEGMPDLQMLVDGKPRSKSIAKAVEKAIRREGKARDWSSYFSRAAAAPFLTGKRRNFRATLVWLLGPTNQAKVDSGLYDGDESEDPIMNAAPAGADFNSFGG